MAAHFFDNHQEQRRVQLFVCPLQPLVNRTRAMRSAAQKKFLILQDELIDPARRNKIRDRFPALLIRAGFAECLLFYFSLRHSDGIIP